MKKILKTALATLFTLIMCFPISAGGHKTKVPHTPEKPSYAEKGLQRWRQLSRAQKEREKQQQLLSTKAELERVKKELKRVRGETEALSEIEGFASGIEYMCICPNPYEFLAAYESLSKSFEEYHSAESKKLADEVYSKEKQSDWASDEDLLKSEKRLLPLCFFKTDEGMLCLAWCGKRSGPITSFYDNLKLFKNLKHIFICGICGCPIREVEVGSVFLSKKFINNKSFTMGGASSAISKKKTIYLFGSAYFMVPDFFSYDDEETFLHYLIENLQASGISANLATNFSFECFIDDSFLAHQVGWRGGEEGATSIIDTESAQFVDLAHQKYTIYSLRVVSDHTGFKIGEIIEGKKRALEVLSEVLSTAIDFWMSCSEGKCKLKKEERKPAPGIPSQKAYSTSDRLPIIFYNSDGWFMRTISFKTLQRITFTRRSETSRHSNPLYHSLDTLIPEKLDSPKPSEVIELFNLPYPPRTTFEEKEISHHSL